MHASLLHSLLFALLSCIFTSYPLLCAECDILLYDFTFKNVIIHINHSVHRELAVLNSEYNKIIEKHYRPNKKRIEQIMQHNYFPLVAERIAWNKNFNECAWVTVRPKNSRSHGKYLELRLLRLIDERVKIKRGKWRDCMFLIGGDKARPVFNNNGDASIFFYANYVMSNDLDSMYCGLLEYSINAYDKSKIVRCLLEVGTGNKIYQLDMLFNLPQLLHAILQSSKVSKRAIKENGDIVKLYNINGATIPEDYKAFRKHPYFGYLNHSLYDELPLFLKDAIDKRLKEQQQSKKMMFNKK